MKKQSQRMLRFLIACSVLTGVYEFGDSAVLYATPSENMQNEIKTVENSATVSDSKVVLSEDSVQAGDLEAKKAADPIKDQETNKKVAQEDNKKSVQKADATTNSKTTVKKPVPPKPPITIVADELYVNDANGDVYAKGNVKITQASSTVTSDLVNGNTKQQEVWVNDSAIFEDSLTKTHLNTNGLRYNYQTKEGTLDNIKGTIGIDRVTGHEALTLNGEIIIHDGTMTRCPAKVPDYHISADKIEIWPGTKLIAYNVKVWLGSMVLYTTPTYVQSLDPNAEQTAYPSISYNSRDGIHIKQRFSQSLNRDLTAYTELNYYGKRSFKNNAGLIWDQKNYWIETKAGYYRDSDSNWVKKWPEYDFHYKSHHIDNLPISYTFDAIYGKWTDSAKTSWHQEYNVYFSHDQIHFDPQTTLDMGTGVGLIKESYNGSKINNFKYDVTVGHTFDEKWYSWVGYHFTRSQNSLFAYNRADMGKELDTGFTYRFDKKNAISFSQSYDLENKRVYDQDYTWYRDLHCWQFTLTYRAKRHEWKWDLAVTRW